MDKETETQRSEHGPFDTGTHNHSYHAILSPQPRGRISERESQGAVPVLYSTSKITMLEIFMEETEPKQVLGRVSLATGRGHALTQLLFIALLLTEPSGGDLETLWSWGPSAA